ncbi:MAG: CoA-transferase, partial [Chthoniobacterales bacterium]
YFELSEELRKHKQVYSDPTAALDGLLHDNMTVAAGAFGLCGIPENLIATCYRTCSPEGSWPVRRNVFTSSPSPQTIMPLKRLNQRPFGTSGFVSSQSESRPICPSEISRSRTRSKR